jgi:hypothetical protein
MDVRAENLADVVEELKHDPRFIGGAVTTPHKQTILALLDDVEEEARLIGAVNALYRKDGKLIGANTDGAGAIKSLETHAGSLTGKTVLLVGLGLGWWLKPTPTSAGRVGGPVPLVEQQDTLRRSWRGASVAEADPFARNAVRLVRALSSDY